MINLKHNFIFCHNEKTAGTAISNVLRKLDGNYYIASNCFEFDGAALELMPLSNDVGNELGHYPNQHTKLGFWSQFIGLSDYFSFGIVRNPKTRMVALFLQQLKARGWKGGELPKDVTLTIDENLSRQTKLPVGKHEFTFDWFCRVFVPTCGSRQTRQLCDYDNNLFADFVGRFENLEEDWKHICGKLEIPHTKLPRVNVSPKYDVDSFFDDDLLEFFLEEYKDEYEVFGYEKV